MSVVALHDTLRESTPQPTEKNTVKRKLKRESSRKSSKNQRLFPGANLVVRPASQHQKAREHFIIENSQLGEILRMNLKEIRQTSQNLSHFGPCIHTHIKFPPNYTDGHGILMVSSRFNTLATHCNMVQHATTCRVMLQHTLCRTVLPCVALYCSALQCATMCCRVL